ncbi:MAG: VOC family protein [Candidatus Abyssobacteria bacterium SURF_5]|uniref:VOC family protein n=1 Tax=Abyssobacteria bacterium (strain SURF_5) TaxID=2093360 RepID=A0A3A4NAF3_ABYX5|nr:MAG: VOC family protein [Candidatus Abyssubacteria bacterium SURF_5]
MHLKEVQHIAISVSDMEKSLAFYRDLLGLEVMMDFEVADNRGIETVLGVKGLKMRYVLFNNKGASINLLEIRNPKGENVARKLRPYDQCIHHFAFAVDDAEAVYQELKSNGIEFVSPPQDLGMAKACAFYGPDGEVIELMEFLRRG